MSANIIIDETQCGPLCQHPTCWYSGRRLVRGTPHTLVKEKGTSDLNTDDSYTSLPTQAVINLLDDYGEDARDKYPAKYGGKPAHARETSARIRVERGESLPRVRAPNATPASPLRSVGQFSSASNSAVTDHKHVTKVEVQEVFEIDDLRSNWYETFQAKKYYVWVPNEKKKKENVRPQAQAGSLTPKPTETGESTGLSTVKVKDITAELVPQQIEMQREASITHTDVWPVLKKKPRKLATSLWKSMPYYYPDCHCETPKPKFHQPSGKYYGVYELLDLPKDVLSQIMQHISESELLDRRKFAEALVRVLPQLEKNSTAISLAYSDVLQQYPVILNDKKATDRSDGTIKPVFLTDQMLLERLSEQHAQLSYLSDRDVKDHTSGQHNYRDVRHKDIDSMRHTKTQPLPSIPVGKGEPTQAPPSTGMEGSETQDQGSNRKPAPLPNISLGLPTIPSGARATKSFTYPRNEGKNFTLAAVVTPSASESAIDDTSRGVSPSSQAPAVSSVHVTVPSAQSRGADFKTANQPERTRQETSEAEGIFASQSDFATTLNNEAKRSTKDSSVIIKIPRPPVNTPNVNTQGTNGITPDVSGTLVKDVRANSNQQIPAPRDALSRSVRFSMKTPEETTAQQYDTDENERNMSPEPVKQLTRVTTGPSMDKRIMSGNDSGKLVVIGQRPQPVPLSKPRSKQVPSRPTQVSWPYVEREKIASPAPSSVTGAASIIMPDLGGDQSAAATYDGASEHSGLTSMMPRSTAPSRESSAHSEQVKRMWHEGRLPQSPAPPPPSPEPARDLIPQLEEAENYQSVPPATPITVREKAHLAILKEVTETDSEITITALPPSNLDDISRINTPNSLASAPRGLMSRENTNLSGVPRVNTVIEVSEGKQDVPQEPWSVGQKEHVPEENRKTEETTASDLNDATRCLEENLPSHETQYQLEVPMKVNVGGAPPHIDTDQLSNASANVREDGELIENGRVEYNLCKSDVTHPSSEENVQQERHNESAEDGEEVAAPDPVDPGGAPPQIDEDQLDDVDIEEERPSYKPLQPGLLERDLGETSREIIQEEDFDNMLDTFDVTEEILKDELKEELEKFKE